MIPTTNPSHSKNGENILTNQNPDKSNQVNLVEMSKVLADDSEIVDTCQTENSSSEKNSDVYEEENRLNEPLFVISSHQSGINGISTLDLQGENFIGQHFVLSVLILSNIASYFQILILSDMYPLFHCRLLRLLTFQLGLLDLTYLDSDWSEYFLHFWNVKDW
jgi:hypothetical protein